MVDARVDRRLFRVRLAADDHPQAAAVTLKTTQTADSAEARQFGVGHQGRKRGGSRQAQLSIRHLTRQLEEGKAGYATQRPFAPVLLGCRQERGQRLQQAVRHPGR